MLYKLHKLLDFYMTDYSPVLLQKIFHLSALHKQHTAPSGLK